MSAQFCVSIWVNVVLCSVAGSTACINVFLSALISGLTPAKLVQNCFKPFFQLITVSSSFMQITSQYNFRAFSIYSSISPASILSANCSCFTLPVWLNALTIAMYFHQLHVLWSSCVNVILACKLCKINCSKLYSLCFCVGREAIGHYLLNCQIECNATASRSARCRAALVSLTYNCTNGWPAVSAAAARWRSTI